MKDRKLFTDILVLILFMCLASLYAYLTRDLFIGKSLIVGAVFTVLPTIYLGWRKPKNWRKIRASILLFGFIFGFIFSFIAEYTLSWEVVSTIFPGKIFGVHTFDTTIGIALMTLLTVTFYEHFIEKDIFKPISRNFTKSFIPGFLAIIVLILIYFLKPNLLQTSHPYFYMGIVAIIPAILLCIKKPLFIKKMAITSIYFFFLYLVIEIFAVSYDYWIYPGNNYVGWVSFFKISFPFEELLFWMLFYTASLISYYEIFIDDQL